MSAAVTDARTARQWPLVAALVIGVGLALAPVGFQMFTRAPQGGKMITAFKPYMTTARIDGFRTDLATIDRAYRQVPALQQRVPGATSPDHEGTTGFVQQWPVIDADMSSMLTTMRSDIGDYDGVAALPPFVLFPWFFVLPGLFVAGLALWGLRRHGGFSRGPRIALVALGLAIVAAPAIFQMFTRAPGGADMIADFQPFMTTQKVTQIQGYFLAIGDGEGDLRTSLLPAASSADVRADDVAAITTFTQRWPQISNRMAPMIGAMSDNISRYDSVKALPPFWLFPWFFVVPGVLVAGLAFAARRPADGSGQSQDADASSNAAVPALEGAHR